ncbi:DUF559 domain-containing protein [Synechococcus sp. AH-707-D15]|nr:DUF559 domain-containing protein [Synechococcus sp. AH-707-D15]
MITIQFLDSEQAERLDLHIHHWWEREDMFNSPEGKTIEEKFAQTILRIYAKKAGLELSYGSPELEKAPILQHIVNLFATAKQWAKMWGGIEPEHHSHWLNDTILPTLIYAWFEAVGGNWKYEVDVEHVKRLVTVPTCHFYKERADWKDEDRYDADADGSGGVTYVDYGEAVGPSTISEAKQRSEHWYKVADLKSPAHKNLCKALESEGMMFWFEAPLFLPGYDDSKTGTVRNDLVVVWNRKAVVVEIDGMHHANNRVQYEADRNRDTLIQTNHIGVLRRSHQQVAADISGTIDMIKSMAAG